ncbi:restriction endonuclease [Streptomyces sp. NPDC055055]
MVAATVVVFTAFAVGLVLVAGAVWVMRRRQRPTERRGVLEQLDALQPARFERAIADLMRCDGCVDAAQVGGAGDFGADVRATDPNGRRWLIQCKHRKAGQSGEAVGAPDLQVLNGIGRVHDSDVVVLVTNGRFTKPAVEFARSQKVQLVDRALLGEWAAGSKPLWELLQIPGNREGQ